MILFEAERQMRFIEGLAVLNPPPGNNIFSSDKSRKYTITEQLLQNHVGNIVIFSEGRGGWDFALLFFVHYNLPRLRFLEVESNQWTEPFIISGM